MSRNFEEDFWDIVVGEVSRDETIRRIVSWTLNESVDLELVPESDFYELSRDMRQKYGINELQLNRAMEICEDDVLEEMSRGQA